jgi:hypothetical protein
MISCGTPAKTPLPRWKKELRRVLSRVAPALCLRCSMRYSCSSLLAKGIRPRSAPVSQCLSASVPQTARIFAKAQGFFFEKQPLVFLQTVREKAVPDEWLRYLLTSLPPELTDTTDMDKVIAVVENRITILHSIDDPSIADVKKKGLRFLEESRDELEEIGIRLREK